MEEETPSHGSKICFPGDTVCQVEHNPSTKVLYLGPGIRKIGDDLLATKVGVVHYKPPATFFLETLGDAVSFPQVSLSKINFLKIS